jgi:hypothetical protein
MVREYSPQMQLNISDWRKREVEAIASPHMPALRLCEQVADLKPQQQNNYRSNTVINFPRAKGAGTIGIK